MTVNCDYCEQHLAMEITVDLVSDLPMHLHQKCYDMLLNKYNILEMGSRLVNSIDRLTDVKNTVCLPPVIVPAINRESLHGQVDPKTYPAGLSTE